MAENYNSIYASKKISELSEAANVSAEDMLVVNQFNSRTGFNLTKKASARAIGEYVYQTFVKPNIETGFTELAKMELSALLNKFRNIQITDGIVSPGSSSLALSSLEDLELGNVAKLDLRDLDLDSFAKKKDLNSSINAADGECITGIHQSNGAIDYIETDSISRHFKIDDQLSATSSNAIANKAVVDALNQKLSKSDANAVFTAPQGQYVAGVRQQNGRIQSVEYRSLPSKDKVDSVVTAGGSNAVTGAAVADYVSNLEARVAALEAAIARIPSQYLRLDSSYTQVVYGPVRFSQKIQGSIQYADEATKAKWS